MAINIKRHFKIRYCQRILDIMDEKEIARHLATQNEQLEEHINRLWEHAEFIWKGALGDNVTRHFYLTGGDTILVVDTDNTCLWTLYRIDFGFPEETNRKVVKDLMLSIKKTQIKADGIGEKAQTLLDKTRIKKDSIDAQIALVQAQINALDAKKLALLAKRFSLDEEVKAFYEEAKPLTSQIEQYAIMLCNSIVYKKDLQSKDKVA